MIQEDVGTADSEHATVWAVEEEDVAREAKAKVAEDITIIKW